METARYDDGEFNLNRSSVSLRTISKSGGQQAHRSNDYRPLKLAFTDRERAYRPSRVHWHPREILVPFRWHPALAPAPSPTRLPKTKCGRASWLQVAAKMTTVRQAMAATSRKLCGRIRSADPFAACSARSACSTSRDSRFSPFTSGVNQCSAPPRN